MLRAAAVGACFVAVAAAACSGGGDTAQTGGSGGKAPATTSSGGGGSGGAGSTGGTGGSGGALAGPRLVIPAVIDLPYTVAGKGGSTASVDVENDGDAALTGISWAISGDAALTIGGAPKSLAPGEKGKLVIKYAGAAAETIASASLVVTSTEGAVSIPVFAVTGDPGLGEATWEDVIGAGGTVCGTGATVDMPAAPYPDSAAAFTDASVRVFLPDGYRDRGAQDLVVHFHGWSTTVAATLDGHLYQEHLWASGANAVLVVPQGPVNAQSGDFGKLLKPGGLSRLVTEVLVLLYREGKIASPALGELLLTSHSGGYRAVATNLDPASMAPKTAQVNLFDSLYGYESTYESFALSGGLLRSNYTQNGGTLASNQAVAAALKQKGLAVTEQVTQEALRDAPAVIDFAASSHDGSTRIDGAYGERIRWTLSHSRRGPRIELREAVAEGGLATVRWLAPVDEDVTGFVVERSTDGKTWSVAAETDAATSEASFTLAGGTRVRVRAKVSGVEDAEVLPSDTYRVDTGASLLVVDGFNRNIDGSFGGLHHDFAARIGEAAGAVATVSHRAITEDGFDLATWPVVIWVLGDESNGDLSLSAAEQQALRDYVDGGGRLVVSGSELAWDIGQTAAGAAFLDHCFGAKYLTDNAGSHTVAGKGPLASIGMVSFAGASAPYACPYPDALTATASGTVLLTYGSGKTAAVGVPGRGALVGFPLELIDAPAARAAVLAALIAFVDG
ncbi:MAG: hypothetical protein QM820_03620 [Minicystis sp.]